MKHRSEYRRCKKCGQDRPLLDFHVYDHQGRRRHECRFCYRVRMNASYLKNRDHRLKRAAERYVARPFSEWTEEERKIQRSHQKGYHAEHIRTVIEHYGSRCACCGETEPIFLTMDHIDGGGTAHRESLNSGLYRWLIKNGFPDGFQVLCYNCNFGKSRNGGICPHKVSEPSTTIARASRAKRPEAPSPRKG